MNEVFVKMTEEEAARRWAAKEGLCLIDWGTLEALRSHAPGGFVIFDPKKVTYRMREPSEPSP